MTHIQSCAKKHALGRMTVALLIQKEITPEEPFIKKTFFEDVIDAAPKQKVKRRKKEESSLKGVSMSRDSILARAQGILSTSTDDCKYQNGGSSHGHSELLSTQAFGVSGLAQMQCSTPSLDGHCPDILDDNVGGDQGRSGAHSTFLTSSLASRPLNVFDDYEFDHKGTQSVGQDEPRVETNDTLYV